MNHQCQQDRHRCNPSHQLDDRKTTATGSSPANDINGRFDWRILSGHEINKSELNLLFRTSGTRGEKRQRKADLLPPENLSSVSPGSFSLSSSPCANSPSENRNRKNHLRSVQPSAVNRELEDRHSSPITPPGPRGFPCIAPPVDRTSDPRSITPWSSRPTLRLRPESP